MRAALPVPVVQLPTRAAGHEFLLLHLSRFPTARGGPTGRRGKVEDTNCVKRHQSIHPVEFYGGKQMTDSQICRVESIFTFILRSEKSQNVRKENNNNKSDLRPLRCIYIPPLTCLNVNINSVPLHHHHRLRPRYPLIAD